ncbi:MAG: helix-turn-helix domain-containing protein [Steroidobacteraceae bacterium]|jgi:IclR family mhp operon transcriptional activator
MNKAASEIFRRGGVRSLERGLALLRLVNEEGGIKPADAAKLLQLPRPTAHRLLETLEELGYVRRSASDSRFLVTIQARRLSGGYDADVRLSEVVGPVLSRLLDELVWPVNIATYRGGMMVVRETTHQRSPLSVDRDMVGLEVPMLRTACGRAYLAFCAESERREIIQYLQTLNDPDDEPYIADSAIQEVLALCRRQGYAGRFNEPFVPRTSSIAMPILTDGYAKGCIAVVWLTSAMPFNRAIRQFVPPLREAAKTIALQLVDAPQLWSMPMPTRPRASARLARRA